MLPRRILAAVAFVLVTLPLSGRAQPVDPLPFPRVEGRNLEDETFSIPQDLSGGARLLFIPFHQWQQREVDTWLARMPELVARAPRVAYYELPTLNTGWTVLRWMIDGGMKSGIADPDARARTITVYTNRSRFMRRAGIPDHDHITVVLLDPEGRIVWRTRGAVDGAKWAGLVEALGLDPGAQ